MSGTGAAAASSRTLSMARAQGAAADPGRPWNVPVLIADDLRFDAMGAMLNRIVRTPNLDALATRGVLFSDYFVTTSICPTSRASMYLGQYAHRHKIWDFATPLSESQMDLSYFNLFRDTHKVGFVGKWGLGDPLPTQHFDYWGGYSGQGLYFETSRAQRPAYDAEEHRQGGGIHRGHACAKQSVQPHALLQGPASPGTSRSRSSSPNMSSATPFERHHAAAGDGDRTPLRAAARLLAHV